MRTLPPWVPLLVFAAAWLAHGAALGADWTADDAALVRDNPVVAKGPGALGAAFAPDAWTAPTEAGVWRPLTVWSFGLEWPLWSGDDGEPASPFGFHLTNLFLHGLAVLLLLRLGTRLLPERPVVVAGAALLLAVHPLHASTVATLVGRADLLALVLGLVAAWLWVEAARGRTALLPLAALAFFLAVLAKETVVGLPLALFALEVAAPERMGARRGAARLAAYGVLLIPVVLWALRWPGFAPDLRAGVDGLGAATATFFVPVGFASDLVAVSDGLANLMVSPAALVVGLAVLLAGALLAWRPGPLAFGVGSTALLWTAAVLVSPPGLPLLARFAYVPGVGLCLLGGVLLHVLVARPAARRVGVAAACVLLVALGTLTWSEGKAFADADAYDRALVDAHPGSDALLVRVATRLREEVVAERLRASQRPVDDARRDALVARTTRKLLEARSYLEAVLRRVDPEAPDSELVADAFRELGIVHQEKAEVADAIDMLRRALRKEPWLADKARRASMPAARRAVVLETLRRLARAEQAVGEHREAAIHLEHAAEMAPDDVRILHAAGRALSRAGEHERARRRMQAALDRVTAPEQRKLVERDLEAVREVARRAADRHLQAARDAWDGERYGEAVAAYQAAIEADPTLLQAYLELALREGQWFGRYANARAIIRAARSMLEELRYPPEHAWWGKLAKLEATLKQLEEEDLEEERDD